MLLLDPAFLFGVIIIGYLLSFVLFAILRVITGISIQRIGYFSLRRIAYSPRDGLKFELRGLGLSLHRRTFAQPTWISIRLTELKVIVDPAALSASPKRKQGHEHGSPATNGAPVEVSHEQIYAQPEEFADRSQTWAKLTEVKERLKRLHRRVHWLAMADVVALNTTIQVVDAGRVQIGVFTMALDIRRKMVDRGRLFRHKKNSSDEYRPAEWIFTVRNILLSPEGKETVEIVDAFGLNVHGLLYPTKDGLRDSSVSLKLGRMHIPYDDILEFSQKCRRGTKQRQKIRVPEQPPQISVQEIVQELGEPGSREESIVQTVSESKEFVSSILRGIQEIQVALTFFRVSTELKTEAKSDRQLSLNFVTHEIGLDVHRLDPKMPAHRMYFSRDDVAHQALLAAISASVSLDDGTSDAQRLLYIPMATTTVRTTLPSKTIAFRDDKDAAERNSNVLFANLVITSPSLDLEPKHLPFLLALATRRNTKSTAEPPTQRHHLISRLLPKASIKLSVHEPVLRFVLPIPDSRRKSTEDYDLLISSISSISLDIESLHSSVGDYSLLSNLRISSHELYYQTYSGERHNLMVSDTLELKAQLSASPDVCVQISGNLKTFSVHMVRQEVSDSVHRVVQQFHSHRMTYNSKPRNDVKSPSFLRQLPSWLDEFSFEGSDFAIEVAGVDPEISEAVRGLSLQLESWTADYKSRKGSAVQSSTTTRRSRSRSNSDIPKMDLGERSLSSSHRKQAQSPGDDRRLTVHVKGLEGSVIESLHTWEPDPFLIMPRFEVAMSTTTDLQGPVCHINSHIKALFLQYSLFRYYSIGVALITLRNAIAPPKQQPSMAAESQHQTYQNGHLSPGAHLRTTSASEVELLSVDVRASLVQVKATMPSDPPLLLQIFQVEAGRHRWSAPFARAQLARLSAEAPKVKGTWASIVCLKMLRVDLRELRRKHGKSFIDQRSIDIVTDFARFGVPHQMIMHKILDNVVLAAKAAEQLHHRFKTGTNEYVLAKGPEGPKNVPRLSYRSRSLLFEIEDGPFEWKLGTIYRLGLAEQRQRLTREEAFNLKMRKLKEQNRQRRGPSRNRTQSAHPHSRSPSQNALNNGSRPRSKSSEPRPRGRSGSRGHRGQNMRYDPEGATGLSANATIPIEEGRYKLDLYNAQSWKKRIDSVLRFQADSMREIRSWFAGSDELPDDVDPGETMVSIPERPALMSALINDAYIILDKPSFPINEYPQYLHRLGKGMPYDMKYSLLIPVNVHLDMGETRVTLRDYPLDLLHIPPMRSGSSSRQSSWSVRTDFVIAEEFRDDESARRVQVEIIPPSRTTDGKLLPRFSIDVRRTVAPVKTYSDVKIDINTSLPTTISWGTSYQPVIQEMMMTIEGFTKPQVDPSDKLGFWDKVRLIAHSRVIVSWKGDGDLHLRLKGKPQCPLWICIDLLTMAKVHEILMSSLDMVLASSCAGVTMSVGLFTRAMTLRNS